MGRGADDLRTGEGSDITTSPDEHSLPQCPDCGVEMEEGFMVDMAYGAIVQVQWHRGEPQQGSLLGIIPTGGVKYHKDQVLKVLTYRCTQCGLLKSYARG